MLKHLAIEVTLHVLHEAKLLFRGQCLHIDVVWQFGLDFVDDLPDLRVRARAVDDCVREIPLCATSLLLLGH